jgi:hypothetical protein
MHQKPPNAMHRKRLLNDNSANPRAKFDLLDIISNNADYGEYIYLENHLN